MLANRICMRKFTWAMVSGFAAVSAVVALAESSAQMGERLDLGLRGVHFVPNHGQWSDEQVYYGFRSSGFDVGFRESSFTMHLRRSVYPVDRPVPAAEKSGSERTADPSMHRRAVRSDDFGPDSSEYEHLTLTVSFPGSNTVIPTGARAQSARFNYFVGDDESKWASDVPSFGAIVYGDLYDGIDLHVMGSDDDGVLKYEFHCEAGADLSQIRIRYGGIDSLCVNGAGDLQIESAFGALNDSAPIVWQDDLSKTLSAHFEMVGSNVYTIALDATPDPLLPIVIDPEVEWMYYVGGSRHDECEGVFVDDAGQTFVIGETDSADFAGHMNDPAGGREAFILRLNAAGEIIWMTYCGGGKSDGARSITSGGDGTVIVAGRTASPDFGGRNNTFHGGSYDAFVLAMNEHGQLLWMSYLGGSDADIAYGIASIGDSAVVGTGFTYSTDFEGRINSHHGGFADACAFRVSLSGQLQWMTYLGGSEGDVGAGVASAGASRVTVTGITESTDFEGRNNSHFGGFEDAFVASLDSSGQVEWMSYLGGAEDEAGRSIVTDASGNAMITGYTYSTDFVGRNNSLHGDEYVSDAFVARVDPLGNVDWMTYLGGGGYEDGRDITIDVDGSLFVTGFTESADFEGRMNSFRGGGSDAFALNIDSSGMLGWMKYLGGRGYEDGSGVSVAADRTILVTGSTDSIDFEGRENAYYGGEADTFAVRLRLDDAIAQLDVIATCPSGGPITVQWSGATPNGKVALVYSRNVGSLVIPDGYPCAGTQLGLGANQIRVLWNGRSDLNGRRTLKSNAPRAFCGRYLQLLDLSTCATSNVTVIE